MAVILSEVQTPALDDLFASSETRQARESAVETVVRLPIEQTYLHRHCPFSFEGEDLERLIESAQNNGKTLEPLIVRQDDDGYYEVVAGLRRRQACEQAGLKDVPAIIREIDDDTAIIAMVDSELRIKETPMKEKAVALRLRYDAVKRKGGRPSQSNYGTEFHNYVSSDAVGEEFNMSGRQVRDYVKAADLEPELLDRLGSGLQLKPAAKLAELPAEKQKLVAEMLDTEGRSPSYPQAIRIVEENNLGTLDDEKLVDILSAAKPQEERFIKLRIDDLPDEIARKYTPKELEEIGTKLLKDWARKQEKVNQMPGFHEAR